MEKGNWGHPKRVWGIEPRYDSGRMIPIYEAIKNLKFDSLIDIACGNGIIADGLKWVFPNVNITQFDFWKYKEWKNLSVTPYQMDVVDFIKEDKHYDVVLFLNSYRNWDEQEQFNRWVKTHARYFITSGGNFTGKKIIGKDCKGYDLELYEFKNDGNFNGFQ